MSAPNESAHLRQRIEAAQNRIEALTHEKIQVVAQYDKRIEFMQKLLVELKNKENISFKKRRSNKKQEKP